jgi:DNA-binding response OmpR family regulator
VKLLLVEDDRKVAAAVRRGLVAEGFSVEVCHDGDEGLWLAREGTFDLLVLDLMLPGRSGTEICAALRAEDDWTPVLMLTATDGSAAETDALDTGADDYLTKPFAFAVLVARVRALVRRAAERDPSPVAVGDLRIDPRARRAYRGTVEVGLTSREFDVLEFFVRRAGEVLTKSEIVAGVWDFAFEGDPNIVEVYVKRLRRKVDEPFGTRSLETVRGAGYRLTPG